MGKILFIIYLITVWMSFITFTMFTRKLKDKNSYLGQLIHEYFMTNPSPIPVEMFIQKLSNIVYIFIPVFNIFLSIFHILMLIYNRKITKSIKEVIGTLKDALNTQDDDIEILLKMMTEEEEEKE